MKFLLQASIDLEVEADTLEAAEDAAVAALKTARTRTVCIESVFVTPE